MELSVWVIIGLGTAILFALAVIAYRLRAGSTGTGSDRLAAAVETLKAELATRQADSLLALRDSIDNANKIINDRLAEGTISLDRRMSVLSEIETQLGRLAVQADNIETVGKNIQSLSDLLKPPKLRGSVGELMLENILGQILPASAFEIQYRFPNGVLVDAAVRMGEKLMPIDSKFPLEAFQRLQEHPEDTALQKQFSQVFQKHIDDIASKYIQPDQRTTDFAVLYVPAEAVYYQLISQEHQTGFDYALARRVIPSSPGHLYAFLASVAALHRESALAGGDSSQNSLRLRAGLDQLLETTERLGRFHNRMEGSLRGLTAGLDHARTELEKLRLEVEKLRDPFEAALEREGE